MVTKLRLFVLIVFPIFFLSTIAIAGTGYSKSAVENAYLCAKWGDENCVKRILSDGNVEVNSKVHCGLTMLHVAAAYGRDHLVRFLLDGGADINLRVTGSSSFFESCEFNPSSHKNWSAATFAKFANTSDDLFHAYLRRPLTWKMLVEAPGFDFDDEIQLARDRSGNDYADELVEVRRQLSPK